VQQEGELLFMHQNAAEFGAELNHEQAAHFLGLAATELQPQLPVQQVSTGTPFWVCGLKSEEALAAIDFQAADWLNFVQQHDGKAFLAYAPDATNEQLLHVRVFTHYYNIPEDPATGSANGCLCGYLARYSYPNQPFERRVRQGIQMGRAAELHLRFSTSSGSEGIWVGGRSKLFARGNYQY
jgi:trans-2,3-dihydro-3-hydroxyanthranilate isomerase